MSEKWETVGKAKPVKGGKANGHAQNGTKKSAPKPLPKLEDVLPASSLQAMYTSSDYKEPVDAKAEVKKPAKAEAKKPAKKETAAPPPKPKVPENFLEAVKMNVRLDDVKKLIEAGQTRYPDSPLLWLRDITNYFNTNLVNQNKDEPGVFDGEPLSALSQNVKKALYALVQGLSESMQETVLETCISNTAHDAAKNQETAGWKVMTQILTDINPSLITANLPRLIELRNSYQNRPQVGLAILWSVGQAGKKEFNAGMKVWTEVMLPLLTLRHYTKFVVDYLSLLLDQHNITDSVVLAKPVMDLNKFVTLQDTVFVVAGAINKECGRRLREEYPRLRAAALQGCRNHEIFPVFIEKLKSSTSPDQIADCLEILSMCLIATPAALVHWQRLYISHLSESGQLLTFINDNWKSYKAMGSAEMYDTVQAFQDYNDAAPSKVVGSLDIGVNQRACTALLAKLGRSGSSWFPWKTISFLLLIGTAAIINLDIDKNKTFEKTHVGHFLKDIGQYERVVDGFGKGRQVYLDGYSWAEVNVPVYYGEVRKATGPALDTALEYAKVSGAYLYVKGGEVAEVMKVKGGELYSLGSEAVAGLDAQLPGLREKAGDLLVNVKEGAYDMADNVAIFYQDLVSGKIDWCCLHESALKKLGEGQVALGNYLTWAKAQLEQLVK